MQSDLKIEFQFFTTHGIGKFHNWKDARVPSNQRLQERGFTSRRRERNIHTSKK